MNINLSDLLSSSLGQEVVGQASTFLGASEAGTGKAVGAVRPAAVRKSGLGRFLPWLVGAFLLLSLARFLGKPPAPPAPPPPPPASAPAAPASIAFPVSVYFQTGKFDIDAEATGRIGAAAAAIRQGSRKVEITGYTDRRGDLAANERLARDRALAVKSALVTAGVPEASITMAQPLFVEVGAPGADADARRVDIGKP